MSTASSYKLLLTVDILTEANDRYFYTFQTPNGITENIVLSNKQEELYHYTQIFNATEESSEKSFYGVNGTVVLYNFEQGGRGHFGISQTIFDTENRFEKEKAFSLYTNVRINTNEPQTGDLNSFFAPVFYDFFDYEDENQPYKGYVLPFPMAINENNEIIANFYIGQNVLEMDGRLDNIFNNHIARIWNKDEFYYEGFRTPHLYYDFANFTADASPFEIQFIIGFLNFRGEYNEQKFNHGDVLVKLLGDETEIFNDSIYKFNGKFIMDTSSKFHLEITNNEVFAYGINMTNHTKINFDMTKDDVTPPVLTMLRVIDNEKITISITDVNTARLEITASDFMSDIIAMKTLYDKKPEINVFWSIDNETFYELPAIEDESKFDSGYGNFFNVSLAPLADAGLDEGWITIKIVLTDEAGNSQTQILDPLFYYGNLVGIEKISLSDNLKSIAYPNPFNDLITIKLNNPISGLTCFEIYDLTGRIIYQKKIDANQKITFDWNGSHLKEGVYFYGIYNDGNVYKGKIVKQ